MCCEFRSDATMQFCFVLVLFQMVNCLEGRPYFQYEANPYSRVNNSREGTRILTHPRRGAPAFEEPREASTGGSFVFPDTYSPTHNPNDFIPTLDGPPKCAGSLTFCEEVENYPENDVLRNINSKKKDGLGFDVPPDEMASRIGEPEEKFLCGATERIIYPQVGKTKQNKWKYIINSKQKDGYVQGVRVEICNRVNRPCDLIGNLPDGYTTSCKQKFVYRRMLSISEGGQPVPDTFLMPSACCCSYKLNTEFLTRFGDS